MGLLRTSPGRLGALATACLILFTLPVFAGNGKIAGKVTDDSGSPLLGANIAVKTAAGVPMGGTTDKKGNYFVLNVPPGTYSVTASYIGYQSLVQTEVVVNLDLTTTVEFELKETAIKGEVVTVVAKRPLVEKTLTSSRATIATNELNNTMPVSDLQELINTTPGTFRGYVRGGRKADTKVLIDGIDVSDTYFRAGEGRGVNSSYSAAVRSNGEEFTSVGVNASSVQSLDIIAGTFNAEYDAATAGVINVVTKEGGDQIEGRLFFRTTLPEKNAGPGVYNDLDKYNAERDALLNSVDDDGNAVADDVAKGQLYSFDNSLLDDIGYGDDPRYETELSLGGPLSSKGSFFFTGRFLNDHGTFSNALNRSARYSLKLTHRTTDALKLTGNVMIDDGGKLGGWVNRDFNGRFKYFPDGAIGNKKLGVLTYIGVTHVLSPETFYEVKLSQLNRTSEFGFSDDNSDGVISRDEDGDFIVLNTAAETQKYLGVGGSGVDADGNRTFFTPDPGNESFFDLNYSNKQYRYGQPGFYYEELKRNVTQLKADLTHQLNFHHQLKAGLLYRRHALEQFQQRTQVKVIYDPQFPFENTSYDLNPTETALYVQDRIEYEGVIINAGLRLDGFDTGAQGLADFFNPSRQDTLASGQIVRRSVLGEDIDVKWFWQPRLGISHPISENAAMYYSWGKFYTPPPFSLLFDEYGTFANPSLPNVADPGRAPPEATAYEIGVQYGFMREYLLDLTAYYRDIEHYSSIGFSINPAAGAGFGTYVYSTDFGYADSRGFEVSLARRSGSRISGRLNYALSYIKASGGAGATTPTPDKTNYSAAAGDVEVALDDRHTFNTIEQNVNGGSNSLITGFDRTHQISLSLLAALPYAVDLSLISTAENGFIFRVLETSDDLRGRETGRAPWNLSTDLRLTRGFGLGGLMPSVFLEIKNLFDRENIIGYDSTTNESRRLWEEDENPNGELDRAFGGAGQGAASFYDPPRRVSLGFSVDF